MNLQALLNLSPTLLGEMLQDHKDTIKAGSHIYNDKSCMGVINVWDQTGKRHKIVFTDLPEEIRKGIHDYTTRLCSEKLLIETALDQSKSTVPQHG